MDSQNGGRSACSAEYFYAQGMVPHGEGVFETLKVVDSRPFALTRHLDRLRHSAMRLGLQPPDPERVRRKVDEHLEAHRLPLGRLRVTWAAAPGTPILSLDSAPMALPEPTATLTVSDWRIDASSPLAGLKTTAYADYAAALRVARTAGFDEALLINAAGDICETSTANIFYVVDDVLYTPPLASGCLPGIARGLVLEVCDVVEVAAPVSTLAEATEVFLTSSLREIQPVSRIDDATYATTGPVTREAINAWKRAVDVSMDPPPADPR